MLPYMVREGTAPHSLTPRQSPFGAVRNARNARNTTRLFALPTQLWSYGCEEGSSWNYKNCATNLRTLLQAYISVTSSQKTYNVPLTTGAGSHQINITSLPKKRQPLSKHLRYSPPPPPFSPINITRVNLNCHSVFEIHLPRHDILPLSGTHHPNNTTQI
jgi:hypothetical protein